MDQDFSTQQIVLITESFIRRINVLHQVLHSIVVYLFGKKKTRLLTIFSTFTLSLQLFGALKLIRVSPFVIIINECNEHLEGEAKVA